MLLVAGVGHYDQNIGKATEVCGCAIFWPKFIMSCSCRSEDDMHARCRVPPCGSNYLVHLIRVFSQLCLGGNASQT